MDIKDAIRELEQLASTIEDAAQDGVEELSDEGVDLAQTYSSGNPISGNMSYSDLAKADHPYATRHAKPLLFPGFINKHRGVFWNAWKSVSMGMGAQIINDSDVADFMKGTKVMHERPIWLLIEDQLSLRVPTVMWRAINKALE